MSGNRRQNSGLSQRDRAPIMPLRSPIFMMPSHRASTPVSPSAISNALLDESKVALTISVKMPVSPVSSSRPAATTKATTKKATQM